MEQQLAAMVLGRPGEGAAAPAPASSSDSSGNGSTATPEPTARGGVVSRGTIKRWQVESFAAVLRHLLGDGGGAQASSGAPHPHTALAADGNAAGGGAPRPLHVVDFGCGTGMLMLPLAVLFPHCHFTGVEMKPAAVALLQERARAAGLANVSAVRGMIETYTEQPFDVCLALHACGNATDAALLLAAARRAAYVVSPCCVGKLKFSLAGGSSFAAGAFAYTPRMPGDRPHSRTPAPAAASAAAASVTDPSTASSNGAPGPAAGGGASAGSSVAEGSQAAACTAGRVGGQHAAEPAAAGAAAAAANGARQAELGSGPGPGPGSGSASGPGSAPMPRAEVQCGQLRHPRSSWLRAQLPEPEAHFRILAKVADQNHSGGAGNGDGAGGGRGVAAATAAPASAAGGLSLAAAAAAACKAHVELDRNMAASEVGYCTGLFKVLHEAAMAKGDLLVGVPAERGEWAGLGQLLACKPRAVHAVQVVPGEVGEHS
ncbi:hypothetical protein HXX76_002410 [Chlamydomonas incerta]|uniref:Methyltransferase domain-containing protein n=1 Tax=Chlamydomonas incerta TaxID=51695 RepID=A0A835TKQ5_CHLIN|nr:hypothetical protein HXX76_002410 [Chlamydomonas incerta]|eukprot:KAG2442324.1 hypothetical protein HXX76_002410 [Chlamydomonas incerta]